MSQLQNLVSQGPEMLNGTWVTPMPNDGAVTVIELNNVVSNCL